MWAQSAWSLIREIIPQEALVLDIGPGVGEHTRAFEELGHHVDTWDLETDGQWDMYPHVDGWPPIDKCGYDLIWASHVVEHMHRPLDGLRHMWKWAFSDGGLICVTVPPAKPDFVAGHVNLYTPALLVYQCVLAGWDMSRSAMCLDGYNMSILVRRNNPSSSLPALLHDEGDFDALASYFPDWLRPVQGMSGWLGWTPTAQVTDPRERKTFGPWSPELF